MAAEDEEDDEVRVKRSDLIEVLRLLEFLVVSLDHIESAFRDGGQEEEALALHRFLTDWGVSGRLADTRFIVDAYFSREVGPDGTIELEREFQEMPCWTFTDPEPPSTDANPRAKPDA